MASIKLRNGSYLLTAYLGYENGKQQKKYRTWEIPDGMTHAAAKKKAQKLADEFEDELKKGFCLNSDITVSEYIEHWFNECSVDRNLKERTIESYRKYAKELSEKIGNCKMTEINDNIIKSFLSNLKEPRIKKRYYIKTSLKAELFGQSKANIANITNLSLYKVKKIFSDQEIEQEDAIKFAQSFDKSLSQCFEEGEIQSQLLDAKTIRNYFNFFKVLFKDAVYDKIIAENPMDFIRPPKYSYKEATCLDEAATKELLHALESTDLVFRVAIESAIYLGLRRGELLGLKIGDIDFQNKQIRVARQLVYTPQLGLHLDSPKSKKSNRTISIPEYLIQSLKELLEYYNKQRKCFGEYWNPENFLFCNTMGECFRPDTFGKKFSEFAKENGLEDVSLHTLRHTHTSLLLYYGVNFKVLSEHMGHSDPIVTTKIYGHKMPNADEVIANELDSRLSCK